jgi:hypothetical protein
VFIIIVLGRVAYNYDLYYKAFSLANNIESGTYRSLPVHIYYPDFGVILGLDFLAKIIYIIYSIYLVLIYIDFGKIGIFVTEMASVPVIIICRSYNNQVLIHLIKWFTISWIFRISDIKDNYCCF